MKVCLANLPWEDEDLWGIRAGCRFPNLMPRKFNSYVPFPFLLAYTASYLESKGIEILLIDGVAERCSKADFLKRASDFNPDLLLIETSTASYNYDLMFLSEIKSQNHSLLIAVCGSHVSVLPEEALANDFIDFVIVGEPEETSYELISKLSVNEEINKIPGLALKNSEGHIIKNASRPMISDIDTLPYPKRDSLPLEKYSVPGFPAPVVYIYGSRGCPYVCNFCLWVQTIFEKRKYIARDPVKIVDEIEYVLKKFPATKSFFFDDDTFNIGRERLHEFAAEMKKRKIFIPWGMNARADYWDKELVTQLMDTGMFNLRIGIESGDPEILRLSGKNLDLDEARRSLIMFKESGLKNHLNFVIGLKGESMKSVENTIKFIKSVPVDSVQFTVAVPFPGTEYYNYLKDNNLLRSSDWNNYHAANTAVMDTIYMTAEEIEKAISYARKKIYFSPRFILKRFAYIRNIRDANAILRKGLMLFRNKN
jgi:anaerobic magnesium-protoporphyrin IX monomethyl ester cyclase